MPDVEELLDQADGMPYGQAKTVLLEQALGLAEASRDRELAFRARLDLTEAYQYGAEPAKSFATFSRSVAEYDAEPARYDEWQLYNLLWQFKWISSDMRRFPEVPLRRAYDALEEMERRYREAGYGLHAVHTQRCYIATHIGDRQAADEWFHRWQTTPRDNLSDCEGCDPSGKVWHLAWMGRDEEAIELAAPVVAGHLTCHVQPQGILSNLLLPYVRTGRLTEAAAAHLKAYRIVQGDANYVDDFGDHMEFCALTGNETRGLEILQRELPLLERSPTPSDRMHFAGCAALLLRRLEETGYGSLTVRRAGTEVPVSELHVEMRALARELAARFDARNGTGEQSRRLEARLCAEPLVEHVPLVPHARRVTLPAGPVPQVPATADPEELLDLAEQAWRRADPDAALAAWARFDEMYGSRDLPPGLLGRRADGHGRAAAVQGDLEAAERHWERAAHLHEQTGEQDRGAAVLGRVGLARCRRDAAEGLRLVEEAHRHLAEHGTEEQREAAAAQLAQAYAAAGRPAEAIALLEDAADGSLLVLLAELLAADPARSHEVPEVAARARQALRAAGARSTLARAALIHADFLRRHGGHDAEEVLGAYGEALTAAPRSEAGTRAIAHAARGELLVGMGRGAEAADDLIEAVATFTALGGTANAALARVDLGTAYLMTGRPLDAAVTAEEALGMLDPEDLPNLVSVRWVRACALRDLDDLDGALADLTPLAGSYAEMGRPWESARALESAAEVLDRLDRDGEAAQTFRAAADRYGDAGDQAAAARALRRHALSLYWSGEPALEAVEQARAALEVLDEEDGGYELAVLCYDEARMLHSLDRTDEAITSCREAITRFTAIGRDDAAERAGDLLERLVED